MKLSYAQNLEDYHLDLAFGAQAEGVYVDVGGGHPVADNVSFHFYLKGWRGLVVEPQAALAATHRQLRPRDLVYEGLAGAAEGEADFHAFEGLHGLSSMVRSVAEDALRFGARYLTERKPVRRLDALMVEAGLDRVDFLKIDVEGAEEQVLAGLDLARVRPRVLVIEVVNPGNAEGRPGPWEARLLGAGYAFALFDNLNRFYVAPGEAGVLARLPNKPVPWDRVAHLWDHGRALDNAAHADRALARVLADGLMATLPALDRELTGALIRRGLAARGKSSGALDAAMLARLTGTADYPGREPPAADLDALLASDRFRASLGRIACFYDGGHLMGDGPADD